MAAHVAASNLKQAVAQDHMHVKLYVLIQEILIQFVQQDLHVAALSVLLVLHKDTLLMLAMLAQLIRCAYAQQEVATDILNVFLDIALAVTAVHSGAAHTAAQILDFAV